MTVRYSVTFEFTTRPRRRTEARLRLLPAPQCFARGRAGGAAGAAAGRMVFGRSASSWSASMPPLSTRLMPVDTKRVGNGSTNAEPDSRGSVVRL